MSDTPTAAVRILALSEAGRHEEAWAECQQVIAAGGEDATVGALHGANALVELGRFADALNVAPECPEGSAGFVHSNLTRGQALHGLERYSEASEAFENAAVYAPALVCVFWARTLRALDDVMGYERVLRAGIAADPTHDEAMLWLAFGLEDTDPEEAEHWYQRALELDPDYEPTRLAYAQFKASLEQG